MWAGNLQGVRERLSGERRENREKLREKVFEITYVCLLRLPRYARGVRTSSCWSRVLP